MRGRGAVGSRVIAAHYELTQNIYVKNMFFVITIKEIIHLNFKNRLIVGLRPKQFWALELHCSVLFGQLLTRSVVLDWKLLSIPVDCVRLGIDLSNRTQHRFRVSRLEQVRKGKEILPDPS